MNYYEKGTNNLIRKSNHIYKFAVITPLRYHSSIGCICTADREKAEKTLYAEKIAVEKVRNYLCEIGREKKIEEPRMIELEAR